jgi:hypothetical protein
MTGMVTTLGPWATPVRIPRGDPGRRLSSQQVRLRGPEYLEHDPSSQRHMAAIDHPPHSMLMRRTSGKVDGHDRGGVTIDHLATARAILTSFKTARRATGCVGGHIDKSWGSPAHRWLSRAGG